jgi:anaerobic selenocysteine-containing dehydrogenase
MQLASFDATRAVCMLRALTGNLDVKGGDFLPQPVPARNIQLKERLPAGIIPITGDYPLFNNFSDVWGNQVQSCVVDAILEERPYPVKMLVSQSGNPAVSLMDSGRVQRALAKLDFLVIIDMFMNRTAKMADVVLPASSCFEKTQLNRAAMRNSLVTLQDQVIEPLGESWPDWSCVVDIHPGDAATYEISENDRVRVETPRGFIVMAAHLSEVVHQGSIRIAWGWGDLEPECSLNRLTDDARRNPVIGTPSGRSFMCRIVKMD